MCHPRRRVRGLRCHVRPSLRRPVARCSRSRAGTTRARPRRGAARFFAEAMRGAPLAEIDPEEFYDFTVRRPRCALEERRAHDSSGRPSRSATARAPTAASSSSALGASRTCAGARFCDEVLDARAALRVRRVVLLGAFLADVVYSRPGRVSGFASDAATARRARRSSRRATRGRPASSACSPTGSRGGRRGRRACGPACRTTSSASPNPRGALALRAEGRASYLDLPDRRRAARSAAARRVRAARLRSWSPPTPRSPSTCASSRSASSRSSVRAGPSAI